MLLPKLVTKHLSVFIAKYPDFTCISLSNTFNITDSCRLTYISTNTLTYNLRKAELILISKIFNYFLLKDIPRLTIIATFQYRLLFPVLVPTSPISHPVAHFNLMNIKFLTLPSPVRSSQNIIKMNKSK